MKSTTLFTLFLLCAVFTSYLPSATADFVYDMEGDVLQNGGTYYVLPAFRGSGGGLTVAATGKERCPLTVVQSPNELDKGIGTIFSSRLRVTFIAEGHLLNITFGDFPVILTCVPLRTEWTIVNRPPEGHAVKIGSLKNTVDGWFKIERVSLEFNDYKLMFCPLPVEDSTCGDLGIHIEHDGTRPLVMSKNKPLVVQFQKVGSPQAMNNNLVLPRSE